MLKYLWYQKRIVLLHLFKRKALLEREVFGEVAEWSIAAVLKTVVLRGTRGSNPCLSAELTGQWTAKSHKFNDLWDFFYPLVSALKYTFSPLKDKVRNLTRTPDKQKRKGGTDCPKLAKSCRYLACLHRAHFKRFTMVLQLKEVNYEIDIQHLLLRKER